MHRELSTLKTEGLHMPYLFHEPGLSLRPARSGGVGPGFALVAAILGTTLTVVALAAIVG